MQLKITNMLRTLFILSFVFCVFSSSSAQNYKKTQDGIIINLDKSKSDGAAKLQLKILSDDIVQVLAYPDANIKEPISLCVENKEWPQVVFETKNLENKIIVITAKIQIEIAMPEGTITYLDKAGNLLLKEDGRSFKALSLPNDAGVSMKQHLSFQKDEAIYGWGQYMDGIMNFRAPPQIALTREKKTEKPSTKTPPKKQKKHPQKHKNTPQKHLPKNTKKTPIFFFNNHLPGVAQISQKRRDSSSAASSYAGGSPAA